jgi:hypothetical protein
LERAGAELFSISMALRNKNIVLQVNVLMQISFERRRRLLIGAAPLFAMNRRRKFLPMANSRF